MNETKSVTLASLRIDGGTQPRAAISEQTVKDYAESMAAGKVFPPVDVFFDSIEYWLADGFHRYFAVKSLKQTHITAMVHGGTQRDATLFSVGVNEGHGLQRTNADKRKAVMTLVNDAEWGKWSGREIGRRCGVSHDFAEKLKAAAEASSASLSSDDSEKQTPRTYTTKHGTEATMHVEKIGRSTKAKTLPDRSPAAAAKRLERIRVMAAEGYTASQIAEAIEISEQHCRAIIKREGIDLPAGRTIGKLRRHDANRIVERMVADAENLTADVNLIEFGDLDPRRLGAWVDILNASRKGLDSFIRRLIKEQRKHEKAA